MHGAPAEGDGLAGAGEGRAFLAFPTPQRARRSVYPLVGAALALGAPLGLLCLRATLYAWPPTLGWVALELQSERVTYAYLTVSTITVFAILGRILGRHADHLRALSSTDSLTGLANLRYFQERLRDELARARRQDGPLSVLLVDVDGLKAINDAGGHEAGDRALRIVALGLVEACRRTDFPARIGGDEFAVLAPATKASAALELAERIRATVRRIADPPIRVSVGVADVAIAGAHRGEALLAAADRALYHAKHGGRDRSSLPPEPARSPG